MHRVASSGKEKSKQLQLVADISFIFIPMERRKYMHIHKLYLVYYKF